MPKRVARLTYRSINDALKAHGLNIELVRGDGYHYFAGDDVDLAPTTSVMTMHLNSMTLEQWLDEATSIKRESDNRKSGNL